MKRSRFVLACIAAITACAQTASAAPALLRFDRAVVLETASDTSANVSIGDLDGDGTLDVVLAKDRHWPLISRVFLNDGHGRFSSAHDLGATPRRSYSARLVDIDGDGSLDIVLSNDEPDPKEIYLNDGHGQFRRSGTFGDPKWPTRNAEVADMNGDALPDVIVANRFEGRGANYVCLNQGHGTFGAVCIPFSREPATTIAAADVDGDGKLDLIVPYRDGGQSYVYLNDGRAGLVRRTPFGPADARFRMAFAADMNGDGLVDIVALDEQRGVFMFNQESTGRFSAARQIDDATSDYALALADLNGDGLSDVIVGRIGVPSTIYFNGGSGGSFTSVRFGDGKGAVYGFAVGDLDGDGVVDIAAARSDAPSVVYFGAR